MSKEDPTWEDAAPTETAQRRKARGGLPTTEEMAVPDKLRGPASELDSAGVPLRDLDYDDVGPTEVTDELASGEQLLDVPMFEPLRDGALLAGRYRIQRILGRGATGLVYEARDEERGRPVAVKVLFPHMAVQPIAVQRLLREAQIAGAVQHPNVVHVYEGGRDGDRMFLVMELLEGTALSDLLAERGALPFAWIAELFDGILSAVGAVHDAGVVHRDLKPDNVFLAMRRENPLALGVPKVLDFGISKLKTGRVPEKKLTEMGIVMGTPYYMAPEQLADTSSVGPRADVYSLGVLLYEAVTGNRPYEGESVVEMFTAATEGLYTPPEELRPDCPPALSQLIARAMNPDAEARYASVHRMRDALRVALADVSDDASLDDTSDVRAALRRPASAPLGVEPTRQLEPGFIPGATPHPSAGTPEAGAIHERATIPPSHVTPPSPASRPGIDPRLLLYLAIAAIGGGLFVAVLATVLALLLR
ncbi:MAG: serine/threonine-protein kinase [Sandaracinaceae bacterium]